MAKATRRAGADVLGFGMSDYEDRIPRDDIDDLPPTGDEARAQRRETIMPLLWIGIGALAIIIFLTIALYYQGPGDRPARFAPSRTAIPGPP